MTLIVILTIINGALLVIMAGLLARHLLLEWHNKNAFRTTHQFPCPACKKERPSRLTVGLGRCWIECTICGARTLF